MSQLSDALEHLYARFVLRDILAKFVPGLLTLALGLAVWSPKSLHLAQRLLVGGGLISLIALYGVSFMTGMLIQFLGMSLGLERIHVWRAPTSKDSVRLSLQRASDFLRHNSTQPALLTVRERYAILKEMAGNYGMAFIVIAVLLLGRALPWHGQFSLGLLIGSAALLAVAAIFLRQNLFHAEEQFLWEGGSHEETAARSKAASSPATRGRGGSSRTRP